MSGKRVHIRGRDKDGRARREPQPDRRSTAASAAADLHQWPIGAMAALEPLAEELLRRVSIFLQSPNPLRQLKPDIWRRCHSWVPWLGAQRTGGDGIAGVQ